MAANTPVEKKPIRDLLQEKDAFLTTSEKFYEYFLRHTKAFITVGVVLVVVIIGTAVYFKQQSSAEASASEAFESALALADGPDGKKAAITALEKVRNDYLGRKAARLAGFTLIRLYMESGDADKALITAQNMLQTIQPAEISLKPMLLNTIGGLSEVQGDFKLAADSYNAILELPQLAPELKVEALMALARTQASAGDTAASVKSYEKVVQEFPKSLNAFLANLKVAEITGQPTVLFPGQGDAIVPPLVNETDAAESAAAPEESTLENQPASGVDEQAKTDEEPASISDETSTIEDGDSALVEETEPTTTEEPAASIDDDKAE